jgi:cobalamin biosynthesis protein CobD/CbiB
MSDARLRELLREADAAFGGPPVGSGDLSLRVRQRARRQRRRRLFGSAAAVVLVLSLSTVAWVNRSGHPSAAPRPIVLDDSPKPVSVAELHMQIERLREEIRTGCQAVHEVLERQEVEQRLAALREQAEADPLKAVNDQLDRAALTMVYQADRMYHELNLRESAVASYQRTIELFPQTHWAQVAKDRLAELKTAGNGDAT